MHERRVGLFVVLSLAISIVKGTDYGHFKGGSMSFTIAETSPGNFEAHIDLITGWYLGKGPCGPNCSESDVGKSTQNTRLLVEKAYNDSVYFGNWTGEISPSTGTEIFDINVDIKSSLDGHIIAVSEVGKWEQEHITAVVPLKPAKDKPSEDKEDIIFEGFSWRDLPLQRPTQGKDRLWHLQSKVDVGKRSDTGRPNASPKAFMKPFYRIRLNSINHITIPAIDPDDDIVKCSQAYAVEGGVLSAHPLPGLTVNENCTITIDTSASLGYTDDMWGGVAITVRDYNKGTIKLNTRTALANLFSLSGATVQFLVQVLENLCQPEFVTPTQPSNHRFYMYAGTTWTVNVYARGSVNTSVEEFLVLGRLGESFHVDYIKDDTRDYVRYTTVSWRPKANDTGSHIICVRAIDNTGVDSAEDRCFIIEVKDEVFHATNISTDKPYFVDLPSYSETLKCDIDATCVFPIYVNSTTEKVTIKVSGSLSTLHIGKVTKVQHGGSLLFEADLEVMHNQDGQEPICLQATDARNVSSDRVCIKSDIISTDPCLSAPCQNSATCSRRANDTADYECHCPVIRNVVFEGKNCIKRENKQCDSHPCQHNARCLPKKSDDFYCYCRGSGYVGTTCEIDENDCKSDSCNGHGICKDGFKGFTCDCYKRYNGTTCSHDLCPNASNDSLSCDNSTLPGCYPDPCNSGICLAGGLCVCPLAYSKDGTCKQAVGDVGSSLANVTIVPPTSLDKSDMVCYTKQNCTLLIYLASPKSNTPTIAVDRMSSDLQQHVNIDQPAPWFGLSGLQNMYLSIVHVTASTIGRRYICLKASDTSTSDGRCFTLTFTTDPANTRNSLEAVQKNKPIKFIDPTPKGNTRFRCMDGTNFHLLLYSTPSPQGDCNRVIPSEDTARVFPPTNATTGECQSEVVFNCTGLGKQHICFQASHDQAESQLRCYDFIVNNKDPCTNNTCEHDSECLIDVDGTSTYCDCQPQYSGNKCEKGPCFPSENPCQHGYCYIDNHVTTCLCPIGYNGSQCEDSLPEKIPDPYSTGARFTDTGKIETLTCIRNRLCSASLVSSGKYNTTDIPTVAPGYTSPSISIVSLQTNEVRNGSFITSVILRGKQNGVKYVCLQTFNQNRVNEDEQCIEVTVTQETSSLWSEKDKPHFLNPTTATNSEITCFQSDPCHIVLFATPGENSPERADVQVTSTSPPTNHIFTSCGNSQTTKNCSFDLVIYPTSKTQINVTAYTSISGTKGEERHYNIIVKQKPSPEGCQQLHCTSGGFCDGHGVTPICHCPLPYTGNECLTDASIQSGAGTQTFITKLGIPQKIKCYQQTPCVVPFNTLGSNLNIRTGYVSPGLDLVVSNVSVSSTNKQQTGTLAVKPTSRGQHQMCLQLVSVGTVDDELCITIIVEGKDQQIASVDQTSPYFVSPTLPNSASVLCEANTECHLYLHFTNGSLFGSSQICPVISDVSDATEHRVHIFPSHHDVIDCSSDVSFIPYATQANSDETLCFEVSLTGKRGERRCFNIRIVTDVISELQRPCLSKTCDNDAKCIEEFPADTNDRPKSSCICTKGYTGIDCSNAVDYSVDLVGVSGITRTIPAYTSTQTPHFDSDSAIPSYIQCEINSPCTVSIPYHGQKTYPPIIGHIDPGMTVTDTSAMTVETSYNINTISLSASTIGNRTLCVQTTMSGTELGENVDEVCVVVEMFSAGSLHQHNVEGLETLQNNTTVMCNADSMCHLTFVTNKTTKCPDIRECGTGLPAVSIYRTMTSNNLCVTDVAIRTKTLDADQELCLTTSSSGEKKSITIQTMHVTEYGACQKLHCQNGGFCDHENGSAICRCNNSYTGLQCEIAPCTSPLPNIDRASNGTTETVFPDGFRVNYTCINGYELAIGNNNGYTCASANNSWIGTKPECIARKQCRNDSDCLNGGRCINTNKTCSCVIQYTNTNCDTAVCLDPTVHFSHATLTTNATFYTDGYNITYKCDPGYEATPNSSFIYTCNFSANIWQGSGLFCVAKARCDNDDDCLNSGVCQNHNCNCTKGHGNTNCDTAVCDGPFPTATHVIDGGRNKYYNGGEDLDYICEQGYTLLNSTRNFVTCNATSNTWEGALQPCVAIVNCTHNGDCLNGGSCKNNKCTCMSGFGNTNCDTVLCTANLPNLAHTKKDIGNGSFSDGFAVTYTCSDGFTDGKASACFVCNSNNNTWIGTPLNCTPIVQCTRDEDCLNNGTCKKSNRTCACTSGFSGTNCGIGPCNPPRDVQNGNFTIQTKYQNGQVLNVTCNYGYRLKDTTDYSFTCDSASQTWSGNPICVEIAKCTLPPPHVLHGSASNTSTRLLHGTKVTYQCDAGYVPSSNSSTIYTCNATSDVWVGIGLFCVPKEHCSNSSDCLNGGTCVSNDCNCSVGFGNTNCDTVVCSSPTPTINHATLITNTTLYTNGSRITYRCNNGYEATYNSSTNYVCDVTNNKWSGTGLICKAKFRCDNDGDCLNFGVCQAHKCNCTKGYGNTNCDTAVCDGLFPTAEHVSPDVKNTIYKHGAELDYTCEQGYTLLNTARNFVTCNATSNTWEGALQPCVPIVNCTTSGDCLNSGSCKNSKCSCKSGFGNTNCDTALCTAKLPAMTHTKKDVGNGSFSDGFTVTYTCSDGFTDGNKSASFVCNTYNNTWIGIPLNCTPIVQCSRNEDCLNNGTCKNSNSTCMCISGFSGTNCGIGPCDPPRAVQQGHYLLQPKYQNGQVLNVTCNPGYRMKDKSDYSFTCDSASQTWSGNPVCIEIAKCTSPPPHVLHGSASNTSTRLLHGTNVTYQCDAGYVPSSKSSTIYTCNATCDVWEGIGLVCLPKEHCNSSTDCLNGGTCISNNCSCSAGYGNTNCDTAICPRATPVINHATLITNTTLYTNGSSITYTCNNGYEATSNSSNYYICDVTNKQWLGAGLTCKVKATCKDNADCLHRGTCLQNKTCQCQKGFGNTNCDTAICDQPGPYIANATPHMTTIGMVINGTVIVYTCKPGYIRQTGAADSVMCDAANNRWVGQPDNCTAKPVCPSPPDVKQTNKSIGNGTYYDGFEVMYTCRKGYYDVASPTVLTCDVNQKQWTGTKLVCIPIVTCNGDADCLNNGTCKPDNKCQCTLGFSNTNCDTGPCLNSPVPILHGSFNLSGGTYQHGESVNVTCDHGFQVQDPLQAGVTCDSSLQIWTGNPVCDKIPVCTANFHIDHGRVIQNPGDLYIDGYTLDIECEPGYMPAVANDTRITCDVAKDEWVKALGAHCIAKDYCDNHSDCIHGTCQTNKTCLCEDDYFNTNCDTPDPVQRSSCDWRKGAERARGVVKQGKASCYCTIQTADGSQKRLQVIKRRPVVTTQQLLTAAGYGAGGMAGGLGMALVIYIVVQNVKKSKHSGKPPPTSSPRSKRGRNTPVMTISNNVT